MKLKFVLPISRTSIRLVIFVLLAFIFIAACSDKTRAGDEAESETRWEGAWSVLALLQTGDNPLWFELGAAGPLLIESPATASLSPINPWPHARYVTAMLLWEDSLVLAVNRYGFLVLGPAVDSNIPLYSVPGNVWEPYTIGSVFIWDHKPAVLLYRNDFFSGFLAPALERQVYTLDKTSAVPLGATIPAFTSLSSGWEVEILRRQPDGLWYYRAKEKGSAQNETSYFRSRDIAGEGGNAGAEKISEKISIEEWRNTERPEDPKNTPSNLAALLAQAAGFGLGEAKAALTVSPDFEGLRFFAASSAADDPAPLYAYCRELPRPLALLIGTDGSGLYSAGGDAKAFSLPPLPEGFVYTGVALFGDVLAASWEEQLQAGIGAAGFMVVNNSRWRFFQ